MKKKLQRLKMIGCLPLDLEGVGFALPVLIHSGDSQLLAIQEVDELDGRVCNFLIFENNKLELIYVNGPSVRIGESPIYAFFTKTDASVGTLSEIRADLERFIKENPSHVAVILQIKELIGSDQDKKIARVQMRQRLLAARGAAVARSFYEGSVLRSVLWNRLLAVAINEEMSRRILLVRGSLSASINQEGKIVLDLSALSAADQAAIDQAKVVSAILLEFEPDPGSIPKLERVSENSDHDATAIQRQVDDLLSLVRQAGRQEERVALLMAAILRNPTVGKSALLQYQHDRAKMATHGQLQSFVKHSLIRIGLRTKP
jgi:hypothetical protein